MKYPNYINFIHNLNDDTMRAISEEQYILENGGQDILGFSAPVQRMPGASRRQIARTSEFINSRIGRICEERQRLREEYWNKVRAGELRMPTAEEELIRRAGGHPDNLTTQAARRCCIKRGIDWRKRLEYLS